MKNDPFGQAILDYLSGDYKPNIRVDSSLTEDEEIPVKYLFRKENELPEKEIIGLKSCEGKVLDAGSGSGTHSLILQEKGFDVTALDYSKKCVEAAQKQGVKKAVYANFFDYNTEEKYDTLLFLMNGLGIMGRVEHVDLFFKQCKKLLVPGGQIIGESTDILYMFEEEDGSLLVDLNGQYHGEIEYQMSYKDIEGDWFNWLYIGEQVLEDAAKKNGFSFEVLYYGDNSDYLVRMIWE